jgi:hypothetical protein
LHSHLDESNLQWNSSCFAPSLDIERQFSKVSINEGAAEIGYRQNIRLKPSGECSSFSSMKREMLSKDKHWQGTGVRGMSSDDICLPEEPKVLEMESSELQCFVAEVIDTVHCPHVF